MSCAYTRHMPTPTLSRTPRPGVPHRTSPVASLDGWATPGRDIAVDATTTTTTIAAGITPSAARAHIVNIHNYAIDAADVRRLRRFIIEANARTPMEYVYLAGEWNFASDTGGMAMTTTGRGDTRQGREQKERCAWRSVLSLTTEVAHRGPLEHVVRLDDDPPRTTTPDVAMANARTPRPTPPQRGPHDDDDDDDRRGNEWGHGAHDHVGGRSESTPGSTTSRKREYSGDPTTQRTHRERTTGDGHADTPRDDAAQRPRTDRADEDSARRRAADRPAQDHRRTPGSKTPERLANKRRRTTPTTPTPQASRDHETRQTRRARKAATRGDEPATTTPTPTTTAWPTNGATTPRPPAPTTPTTSDIAPSGPRAPRRTHAMGVRSPRGVDGSEHTTRRPQPHHRPTRPPQTRHISHHDAYTLHRPATPAPHERTRHASPRPTTTRRTPPDHDDLPRPPADRAQRDEARNSDDVPDAKRQTMERRGAEDAAPREPTPRRDSADPTTAGPSSGAPSASDTDASRRRRPTSDGRTPRTPCPQRHDGKDAATCDAASPAILLFDFAAAFPSVDRRYIHECLDAMQLPPGVRAAVCAVY